MLNVFFAIAALVLLISIMIAGVSYVNLDSALCMRNETIIKTGIVKISSSYHVYKINNNQPPKEVDNWAKGIKKPSAPVGMDWSYSSSHIGNYFCLSGNVNDENLFGRVGSGLDTDLSSFFINDTCGATENNLKLNEEKSKTFTLWVDRKI